MIYERTKFADAFRQTRLILPVNLRTSATFPPTSISSLLSERYGRYVPVYQQCWVSQYCDSAIRCGLVFLLFLASGSTFSTAVFGCSQCSTAPDSCKVATLLTLYSSLCTVVCSTNSKTRYRNHLIRYYGMYLHESMIHG